jgi:uncharacterized protein RhaS with RHS repeats
LRARWYNPADGRFFTKDPSGAESNLYLYAQANPVNYSDPLGLYSQRLILNTLGAYGHMSWYELMDSISS